MVDREQEYLAYLLRLWRAGPEEDAGWHASLQDARTGQRVGFACLDDVVAYLRQRMSKEGGGAGGEADGAYARGGSC